mmetsp:Transcript_46757/g.97346  ORF Transcript_46757/g.97346 Transcript_46757/m.97346 type:complete len:482 (-) Transcript_46757:43-1488(-)
MRLLNTRLRWLGVLALFVNANASQHALRHLRHRAGIAVPELQKGRHVVVNGLIHSVELNGQEAVVEGYDAASARYVLRMASGAYRKVKQEHVTASSYSNSAQKESPCTMEAGAGFAVGSQVRLHDLHSPGAAELNGELGLVRCFSTATGRYTVELSDGTVRAIRPEHLSTPSPNDAGDEEIPRSSGSEVSASVEDVVQEASEISKLSTAERFPQKGARVKLVGLKAKSMNGKVVKITSYENSTQRYIVKLPDGSMRKVEASKLQSTDEAPRPRLSVCNAYKLHEQLKVVLNSETGTSKVLAMLDFASCEDFEELPFDKGSISLLLSSMQVANVPFDLSVLGPGRGTELTVAPSESKAGSKSKAKVLQNIVELDDGGAYYLHLVNAHVGSRPVQLSVQRGPVAKVLPMDKSYRLERVEDMSLTLMDGERRLRLAFNPQKSRTYCAIVTGGSDGENQDAQRVGLVLHKLGEWTSAEQLDKEAV